MPNEKIMIDGVESENVEVSDVSKPKKVDIKEKEVISQEKSVKVRFKRDINFYYGEKKIKYAFNSVKSIPMGHYEVLKANPNNLEVIV